LVPKIFCRAVETHCGYGISRSEIYRIAERAKTAEDFGRTWNHEDGWQDDE